jgi:hypothetical protein
MEPPDYVSTGRATAKRDSRWQNRSGHKERNMRISVEIAAMLAMVRQSLADTALQVFVLLVALFAYQRIRQIKQQKLEEERRERDELKGGKRGR